MSVISAENATTFENLTVAFGGESNADARYTAFAAQADAEGLPGAASLFRATARAEQIHANNHARVIVRMGGRAECEIKPTRPQSTLENLRVALAGEQHEIDQMYPAFIGEALGHNHSEAVRSMQWALEAERGHARLFAEAIAQLESGHPGWMAEPRDFYVCTVCGWTSETPDEGERCPVCKLPTEKFEVIR